MAKVNVTLTWKLPFESGTEQYGANNWIYQVVWRQDGSSLIPDYPGIYVIEDPVNHQVYVGKASSWRDRFGCRSEALREFRLSTQSDNPVDDFTLRLASVNPARERSRAEEWLIRILYKAQAAKSNVFLQNKQSTKKFKAPKAGFTITNADNGYAPNYLEDAYTYKGGAVI
jgi:hypothetical protein